MKDGIGSIVFGAESAPQTDSGKYVKFVCCKDKSLAIIMLVVDPENPVAVWKKLADQLSLRQHLNNLRLNEGNSLSCYIKAMTEIFIESAVIGVPIDKEDKAVTLLASLPETYNVLVTALEASIEVPQMEVVTEHLLYEEKKPPKTCGKVMAAMQSDKRPPKCHYCGKRGHIKHFCKDNIKGVQTILL